MLEEQQQARRFHSSGIPRPRIPKNRNSEVSEPEATKPQACERKAWRNVVPFSEKTADHAQSKPVKFFRHAIKRMTWRRNPTQDNSLLDLSVPKHMPSSSDYYLSAWSPELDIIQAHWHPSNSPNPIPGPAVPGPPGQPAGIGAQPVTEIGVLAESGRTFICGFRSKVVLRGITACFGHEWCRNGTVL